MVAHSINLCKLLLNDELQLRVILSHYPSLFELNLQLLAVLMDYRLFSRYVEGQLILVFGLVYCLQNMLFMWITWIDRHSGNANFFYFQTIVYQLFHSVMFVQLYGSVDKKRKK